MVMFHYFVNQPYLGYPHEAAADFGAVMFKFSNRHFDPEKAAKLYARYHREFALADQLGFDSILVNEHHNAPAAMSPSPNISATVLAKITSRAKIFIGGNILPIHGNPLRLAEELAMIDLISGGRLIAGFVRGGAVESLAHDANTVHNREVFDEAHTLILKIWTEPGPFCWEGKHFQYRVVNPWMLPLQKPHPPILVPGSTSAETVLWAAEHGYPYIALATRLEATDGLFRTYDDALRRRGIEPTQAHHGYVIRVHVAATDEQAHTEARALFGGRIAQVTSMTDIKIHPDAGAWMAPPGYVSKEAARQRRKFMGGTPYAFYAQGYDKAIETAQIVVGSPDTVVAKLDEIRRRWNLGHIGVAHFPSEDESVTERWISALAAIVIPRLREIAAA